MSLVPFTKAVALGNDFVILDAREHFSTLTPAHIRKLANRREGVGCDQLLLLLPPIHPEAELFLKFYNADGSEAEACGNGTRCAARLILEETGKDALYLQTARMLCQASWSGESKGEDAKISVTMGEPRFAWDHIPLAHPEALWEVFYNIRMPFCVNIGNPHVIFFVDDVETVPLATIGPEIENHPAFPERVNVGFAQVVDEHTLRLRVWERGAGYTMACGTGACAATVAAIRQNLFSSTQSPFRIIQEGGEILVSWQEGQDIMLTGQAQITFRGEVSI